MEQPWRQKNFSVYFFIISFGSHSTSMMNKGNSCQFQVLISFIIDTFFDAHQCNLWMTSPKHFVKTSKKDSGNTTSKGSKRKVEIVKLDQKNEERKSEWRKV